MRSAYLRLLISHENSTRCSTILLSNSNSSVVYCVFFQSEFFRRVLRRNLFAGCVGIFPPGSLTDLDGYELPTLRFLAEWADLQILEDASLGETLLKKMLDAASFLLQYWTTMPCSMEEMLRDSLEMLDASSFLLQY